MGNARPVTLRALILLLAAADLVILGMRLRPWSEIVNLPNEGTPGFDPIVCLLIYIFLLNWLSGNKNEFVQKALSVGTFLGLPAGVLLIGNILLNGHESKLIFYLQIGLMVSAGVLWGMAGMRGAAAAGSTNIALVSGAWSSMVSALMACAAILTRIDLKHPLTLTQDPWKQYEGLAIGNTAMQYLVHSLVAATGFLLICPLVGAAAGLVFALARAGEKRE
jgi:hypothetical protein